MKSILRYLLAVTTIFAIVFSAKSQSPEESLMKGERMHFERKLELQKKGGTGLDYDLVYHRIELSLNPYKDSISGSVLTQFRALEDQLEEIAFDLRSNMKVDSVLKGSQPLNFRRSGDLLYINLSKPISAGDLDSVHVFYHGNPVNNPYNSYEREKRRPRNPHPAIWTLSQPYGAHAWWPCKETLTDKIDSLDVWITVPKGNKAASLGTLLDSLPVNDSTLRFRWQHRYPVITYLIAVAVSNYAEFTDLVFWEDGDSMPILNYVYPEYVPSGREPARETVPMMHLFDSLFGPYPFRNEKYGHAQMLRSGGMEHQTMSFMSGLEYGLVAHELAHQWFGDKVTCASWSDLWLNEGFATYLSYVAYEFLRSEEDAREELQRIRTSAMSENNGSVFVADTLNISRLFSGRLTYSKGALVLHMLRWTVGDEAFFRGLRNYLSDPRLAFGSARTADLQWHLEQASGKDLNEFMADWFYGEGYPTYIIRWRMVGNEAELKIKQIATSTVDFFNIEIPVQFLGPDRDTTMIISPQEGKELYRLYPGFIPDSIRFDPDMWIMAKSQVFSESSIDRSIFLYPVPAQDELRIRHQFGKIGSVQIFDLHGRVISESTQFEENGKIIRIPLDVLIPGCYLIEIQGDSGILRSSFIKAEF